MTLCDRCPEGPGCTLDYLGDVCTKIRKIECPDVVPNRAEILSHTDIDVMTEMLMELIQQLPLACENTLQERITEWLSSPPAEKRFEKTKSVSPETKPAPVWEPAHDAAVKYFADANPSGWTGCGHVPDQFYPEPRTYEVFPGMFANISMTCERKDTPDKKWRFDMCWVDPNTGKPKDSRVVSRYGIGTIDQLVSGLNELFPRCADEAKTRWVLHALSELFVDAELRSQPEDMISFWFESHYWNKHETFTVVRQQGRHCGEEHSTYMLYKTGHEPGKTCEPQLVATGTLAQVITIANFVDDRFNEKIKAAIDSDHTGQWMWGHRVSQLKP